MKSVFISYARRASAPQAEALHRALGDDSFLDESDVETGARFPEALADALLGSRVVVVFADEAYFRRWYCLWELRVALGPAALAGEAVARLDAQSLEHVVVALPAGGRRPAEIDRLPRGLSAGSWPCASETAQIAKQVAAKLRAADGSVGRTYAEAGFPPEEVKIRLLELVATPPPRSLSGLRTYPPAIPPPLKTFVGRSDDLWRVDFALSTLGGRARTARAASIEGGDGAGKSALAREYLHRIGAARFRGGLFWIDAEESLDAQFHGVLQTLRAVPDLPEFHRERRDARRELEVALNAEAAKAPILWVVDNVPEEGAPLRKYCPALGKVTLLATARHKVGALEESVCPVPLGALDVAPSVDLLVARSSLAPPPSSGAPVVEWVGRLPGALVVLNAGLRLGRVSLPELVEAAKEGAKGSSGGVEQAFALLYGRLSPEAREAARLIAHLAPSPIPAELGRRLGLPADVRSELLETSFASGVESEPRGTGPELPALGAMPPLLANYLRSRATGVTAEVTRAVEAVISTLNDALKARDRWRALLRCAPHARHLLRMTHPAGGAVPIPMELRAALAAVHSDASDELGRREEALAAVTETVGAYRRLAEAKPDAFEPALAMSLNNLSYQLSQVGRKQEALAALEDAVQIRRQLAKSRPDEFEPALALSLNGLSSCLSLLRRRQEALIAIRDAVEIQRRLAEATPAAFEPDLAASLNDLSNRLSELGRTKESLAAIRDAVEIRRRLAKARPAASEADLAGSLNVLSNRLSELGRMEEAVDANEDAVEVHRRLAEAMPAEFGPELAGSLNDLSNRLNDLGRVEEARAAIAEAADVYRRLANARPETFEPHLALTLNTLSNTLKGMGRQKEALVANEEAVGVYRRLAEARPTAFEPNLAVSLNNLFVRLSRLGRNEEALAAIEGAVGVYRRLMKKMPNAFALDLVVALKNLSKHLREMHRDEEALEAADEVREITHWLGQSPSA